MAALKLAHRLVQTERPAGSAEFAWPAAFCLACSPKLWTQDRQPESKSELPAGGLDPAACGCKVAVKTEIT